MINMNVIIDWQADTKPTEEETNYVRNLVFSSEEYKVAEHEGKRLLTVSVSPDDIKVIKKKIAKSRKAD